MIELCQRHHDNAVALLTEGVDRNFNQSDFRELVNVALLTEGVDRNTKLLKTH